MEVYSQNVTTKYWVFSFSLYISHLSLLKVFVLFIHQMCAREFDPNNWYQS